MDATAAPHRIRQRSRSAGR